MGQFDRRFHNWYPIIPLSIRGAGGALVEVTAYLDTGAAFSIFHASEADAPGIDLSRGRKRQAIAGDGGVLKCAVLSLPVEVGNCRFLAETGFSRELRVGFNMPGLHGFFDRFSEVVFRHREKRAILRPQGRAFQAPSCAITV
jgi:hypothetical protein